MSEKSGKIKVKRDITHVALWTQDGSPDIVLNQQAEIRQFLQDCARHGWPVWLVSDMAIVFAAGKWGQE